MIPRHSPVLPPLDGKAPTDAHPAGPAAGSPPTRSPSGAPSLAAAIARREGGAPRADLAASVNRLAMQKVMVGLSDGKRLPAARAAEHAGSLDLLDALDDCEEVLRDPRVSPRPLATLASTSGMPQIIRSAAEAAHNASSPDVRRQLVVELRAELLALAQKAFGDMDRKHLERAFRDLDQAAEPTQAEAYPTPDLEVNDIEIPIIVGNCSMYLEGLAGQWVLHSLLRYLQRTAGGATMAEDLDRAMQRNDADRCRELVSALVRALESPPPEAPSP